MEKEFIELDPEDKDLWLCLCGNHIWQTGFYPCRPDGSAIDPAWEATLESLQCCGDCGRIISPQTREVVGMASKQIIEAR